LTAVVFGNTSSPDEMAKIANKAIFNIVATFDLTLIKVGSKLIETLKILELFRTDNPITNYYYYLPNPNISKSMTKAPHPH
jgi:hypothetical protein